MIKIPFILPPFLHNWKKMKKVKNEELLINREETINLLKHTLVSYEFERMYKFFRDVCLYNRNDVVVFTTRRCHLLFSLFSKYVFTEQEKEILRTNHKLYISDKAVPFYKKNIKKHKILIVDDIMIHGRALNDVKRRVMDISPKKIEICVYAISENDNVLIDDVKYIEKYSNGGWKNLSNQIVASLILTSTPYTSYIYSYSKKMDKSNFESLKTTLDNRFTFTSIKNKDMQLELSLQESDNSSYLNDLLSENIQGYIYPMSNDENNKEFLRIYYNKKTKICIIIPTAFLPTYTRNELYDKCKNFNLLRIAESEPEIMYRGLTAHYSLTILEKYKDVLPKKMCDSTWIINKDTINMSYYNDFYKDLQKKDTHSNDKFLESELWCESLCSIHKFENYKNKYHVFNKLKKQEFLDNDIYFTVFKDLIKQKKQNDSEFPYNKPKNHDSSTLFLYDYIREVNYQEEQYLNKTPILEAEKQVGFSFVLSKFIFEKNIMSKFQFYSKLISGADSGLITFYPDKFSYDGIIYYSNFLITGEQVCRLYQNKYFIFVLYLLDYYNKMFKDKKYQIKISIDEYKQNILNACSDKTQVFVEQVFNYLDSEKHLPYDNYIKFYFDNIYEGVNDEELDTILYNANNYLS